MSIRKTLILSSLMFFGHVKFTSSFLNIIFLINVYAAYEVIATIILLKSGIQELFRKVEEPTDSKDETKRCTVFRKETRRMKLSTYSIGKKFHFCLLKRSCSQKFKEHKKWN